MWHRRRLAWRKRTPHSREITTDGISTRPCKPAASSSFQLPLLQSRGVGERKLGSRWLGLSTILQRVNAVPQRRKRDETAESQDLVKWQDPELGEMWESYSATADMVTGEDLQLLRRAGAGEGAAR